MQPGRGSRHGRRWWVLTVGLAAIGIAVPSARAAGPWLEVENLRVGFASNAQNNLFKVGTWTPVGSSSGAGTSRSRGRWRSKCPTTTARRPRSGPDVDVPAEPERAGRDLRPARLARPRASPSGSTTSEAVDAPQAEGGEPRDAQPGAARRDACS